MNLDEKIDRLMDYLQDKDQEFISQYVRLFYGKGNNKLELELCVAHTKLEFFDQTWSTIGFPTGQLQSGYNRSFRRAEGKR